MSVKLIVPPDMRRDHIIGPEDAPVTMVEYGDYQCPYCGDAYRQVERVRDRVGPTLRYVFRHYPLMDLHPLAPGAALAAEAAAAQGRFWDLHNWMYTHQDSLQEEQLVAQAEQLGLDVERFRTDLAGQKGARHIKEDVVSATDSGVTGTPAFYINDVMHTDAYDQDSLMLAIDRALGFGP